MLIDKQQAVRRLLHASIRYQAVDDDPVPLHLMIMASMDNMREYAKAKGRKFHSITDWFAPSLHKEVTDKLKAGYYFLKHSKKDADQKMDTSNFVEMNKRLLITNCLNYRSVFDHTSKHIETFLSYCAFDNPEFLQDDARKALVKLPGADELLFCSVEERRERFRNTLDQPEMVAEREADHG